MLFPISTQRDKCSLLQPGREKEWQDVSKLSPPSSADVSLGCQVPSFILIPGLFIFLAPAEETFHLPVSAASFCLCSLGPESGLAFSLMILPFLPSLSSLPPVLAFFPSSASIKISLQAPLSPRLRCLSVNTLFERWFQGVRGWSW